MLLMYYLIIKMYKDDDQTLTKFLKDSKLYIE